MALMTLAAAPGSAQQPLQSDSTPGASGAAQATGVEQQPQDETPTRLPLSGAPRNEEFYRKLREQVPDPVEGRRMALELLEQARRAPDSKRDQEFYENGLAYLSTIDRKNEIELTLAEVIQRTLDNSYNIRVQSYNPAIRATNAVEAEAVFDALFFSNATWNKNNTPTATTLQATDSNSQVFNTGARKLLPTGMSVQAAWNVNRNQFESRFAFATLNPSYRDELSFQLRQPFLRGFGIDFNRAQINLSKNDRRISEHQFSRAVQDHLLEAERAYWQLANTRRILVITARLISEYQRIYDYLKAREGFDASPVEIAQSRAQLDTQVADFARVRKNVRDAEDNLKNLMNDAVLNLADDLEIIPADFPTAEPIILDPLAELQSALDNRDELKEAELAIESARISVGAAKNQALPRFDVLFEYTYDSLGKSQRDAFHNLSHFDFHNYTVGLQFEWPIGNRGPRAALRRARLQHAQANAALKLQIEEIIRQVNVALRELATSFEQIDANLTSVKSQMDNVQAIEDRAERRDPNQLFRELSALESLAGARQRLLQSLITYDLAASALERAKGTLLKYNNVAIQDSQTGP